MKIVASSTFKNQEKGLNWFNNWKSRVKAYTKRDFNEFSITTSLGTTQIYSCGNAQAKLELVIFPGFRTSSLFWDLDLGLDYFMGNFNIYLIETNGQPNPSAGNSPAIRSLDYGIWATEVLDALSLNNVYIAGASFGGLVCMKLAIVSPDKIKGIFLFNPGCLQNFSLKWRNLYANLLPLIVTNEKTVRKFLDMAVFCNPHHRLDKKALDLLVEYEVEVIRNFKDQTQKPYFMNQELCQVQVPIWLFCGKKDTLFPLEKSFENAKRLLPNLVECVAFDDVAHGIETYRPALSKMAQIIQGLESSELS